MDTIEKKAQRWCVWQEPDLRDSSVGSLFGRHRLIDAYAAGYRQALNEMTAAKTWTPPVRLKKDGTPALTPGRKKTRK